MEVLRDGSFMLNLPAEMLARGLRPSAKMARDKEYLVKCAGAVGYDNVLQVIEDLELKRIATELAITDGFPYPQIFVCKEVIIVCGLTAIYEYHSLTPKLINIPPGLTWTCIDYGKFIYLSNCTVAVIRDAMSGVYHYADDYPTEDYRPCRAGCDNNGQAVISPCPLYVAGATTLAPTTPTPTSLAPTTLTPTTMSSGEYRFIIAPQYTGDSDEESGIGIAKYNPYLDSWTNEGEYYGGAPTVGEPNTVRANSSFIAHYADWYKPDANVETMKLLIFEGGVNVRDVDLWTYVAGNTNWVNNRQRNLMDIGDSGLIACLCYMVKDGGVSRNAFAVKVSLDRGASWKPTYYFPTIAWLDRISGCVRIDANEVIWVYYNDYTGNQVNLYKSEDKGDTWTLVYNASTGTDNPYDVVFTVDPTGQYQYVNRSDNVGGTYHYRLYKSSDYGNSWTPIYDKVADINNVWSIVHVSDKEVVVIPFYSGTSPDLFKVSGDYGATFSDQPPSIYPMQDYYVDHQNKEVAIIYTECGSSFVDETGISGFLFSLDSGINWNAARIPMDPEFTDTVFANGWQGCVCALIET